MTLSDSKHESGIRVLIDEFGGTREGEIRVTYDRYRRIMERGAKVTAFIPVLAFAATKRSLLHRHRHP